MEIKEIIEQVKSIDSETAKKLEMLREKVKILREEGNVYGERYTSRQIDLNIMPIFEKELFRAKILLSIKDEGKSVKELADEFKVSPKNLLFEIVELRKKNMVYLQEIRDRTPIYRSVLGG